MRVREHLGRRERQLQRRRRAPDRALRRQAVHHLVRRPPGRAGRAVVQDIRKLGRQDGQPSGRRARRRARRPGRGRPGRPLADPDRAGGLLAGRGCRSWCSTRPPPAPRPTAWWPRSCARSTWTFAETALGGTTVVALTADLLGRSQRDLGKALSFSRLVPSMGDEFDGGPDPAGDALTAGGDAATMAGLVERAAALAGRTGLGDADRLLSGRPLLTVDGAVDRAAGPVPQRRRGGAGRRARPGPVLEAGGRRAGDAGRARTGPGRRRPRHRAATARARSLPPAGAAR